MGAAPRVPDARRVIDDMSAPEAAATSAEQRRAEIAERVRKFQEAQQELEDLKKLHIKSQLHEKVAQSSGNIVQPQKLNQKQQQRQIQTQGNAQTTSGVNRPPPEKKVRPNDKCPCRSGRKWKLCHGRPSNPQP
jgi:DNA-binding FadR family transcriptional regulator